MSESEPQNGKEYDYEPFADTQEYRRINKEIIKRWIRGMMEAGTEKIEGLLDIATGVGTMVRIFLEEVPEDWDNPRIVCLDKSSDALKQAKQRIGSLAEEVDFIHCPVEELDEPRDDVEVVLWGNGIHYLDKEDQKNAVKKVKELLDPAWFLFNTAFYEEARPEETIGFYRSQVRKAAKVLRSRGVERDKSKGKPEAANFFPRSHYKEMISRAGFSLSDASEFTARFYRKAWERISGFKQYAEGALHGYPPEEAAESLKEAVGPALKDHGKEDEEGELYVPRRWLAISAKDD